MNSEQGVSDAYHFRGLKMTKEERLEAEKLRLDAMYADQRELTEASDIVFGIDEAGRGPLCGPVVAGCCILGDNSEILWLNDSKKISEKKRELIFEEIKAKALAYGIGTAGPERIDEINILNATYEAMQEAYENCRRMLLSRLQDGTLAAASICILVDGNKTVPGISEKQTAVVKGDARCPAISAASILAKVTRDRMMEEYDKLHPEYGLAKHKGYGTREHIEAIRKYGITDIYRKSFLKKLI